jgi:hypothetical protein
MTVDDLADVLRRRDCDSIWYFHTDHFEPWSLNIDDESARAVDRMAAMARTSEFARKLSLFYAVFVPYHLEADVAGAIDGDRVEGDRIVFGTRSAEQEKLAREAIRPLVTDDDHEVHLHVHHEYWTRNTSHFDNPVSHWVNSCSTPDADRQRLDLYFRLCCEATARELGRPFDNWGFIHGNWALNGSDHEICLVDDELRTIMRHGGFGDFSFPAGRGVCDPRLEAPFTCRPLPLPRAYDDPRAEPQAVGVGAGALRPDRFFIWNSPIKSGYSSIDYYSKANRELFKTPERMVAQWLGKSVVLDRCLFLKTHSHSMKWEYRVEPEAVIPHCYPAVGRVFDCLARVCERAGVELRPVTVNEVMARLRAFDLDPAAPPQPTAPSEVRSIKAEQIVVRPARSPAGEAPNEATLPVHVLNPPFTARGGAAWTIALPATLHAATDTAEGPNRSPLLLLEDGAPLGPGHALHRDIHEKGQGRYSFWKTGLWFSTSDGSDPNRNGRVYAIAHGQRPQSDPAAQSALLFAAGLPRDLQRVALRRGEASGAGGKPMNAEQLADVAALDHLLVEQMLAILAADGADASGFYEYYQTRLEEGRGVLSAYDRALVHYMAANVTPTDCRIVHAGIGVGQLALALALLDYNIAGIERDMRRFTSAVRLREAVGRVWPAASARYTAINGEFPEVLLGTGWIASDVLLIFTNCSAGWSDDLTDKIIATFPSFGHVILDARVFGVVRDTHDERQALLERIQEHGLSIQPVSGEPALTHYYHVARSDGEQRVIGGRGSCSAPLRSLPYSDDVRRTQLR